MKLLDVMISKFDDLTLRAIHSSDLQNRENEFNSEAQLLGNATNRLANQTRNSVDTKATAVLQHVSIMIAISGLLYTQSTPTPIKLLFVTEMLLYVALALCCLRLLMTQSMLPSSSDGRNVVAKEAFFDLTAKFTYFISIILVLTIIAEVIFK